MHKQCNKVHFLTQAQKPCNPEKPNPAPCATRERARQAAWRVGADFILHPLIRTRLGFNLVQEMVICQRGEKNAPTDQFTYGQWGALY